MPAHDPQPAPGAPRASCRDMTDRGPAADAPDTPTHPRIQEPAILLMILVLSVGGAVVGLQLLVTLGVTPNTGLIGALVAMTLGRLRLPGFRRYRSVHVQNLAQSAVSAACFGAANAMLLPIGIPFLLGMPSLVFPLFAGVTLAIFLDAFLLYRLFGTRVFPADGAWPAGVAAAEAIQAGDRGGAKAAVMAGGLALGVAGGLCGVPMAAFGTALIGNAWALSMFGIGLLVRGQGIADRLGASAAALRPAAHLDPALVPHGVMVGAGLVALIQVGSTLMRHGPDVKRGRDGRIVGALALGGGGFLGIAGLVALLSGVAYGLTPRMLVAFVAYAAFAAFLHELIVGLAAMHSGWFPAFAIALITLLIGSLCGFPMPALALLAGLTSATGPAFADMGYDLKAGFLLRGGGANPAFEQDGRRQQLYTAFAAFVIATCVVAFSWRGYFTHDLFPPPDRVYAAAIRGSAHGSVAWTLAFWAIPGAILQMLGGQRRQMGVLLATGLLIVNLKAGWAVLAGLAARAVWLACRGESGRSPMEIFAGGVIAGDALFSFFSSMKANIRIHRH
ncbi:OPT family oligopeptide transporter [Nguyenibacter sp. L1]|uniref:OPT family oligopeptide transporter n=1 Tax=Nguyenibacter sp. L1 TaxID=3049350 RepID=UPI002B46C840|nr:OPT family oligopeptide transporter [Nguyenibacter sp. L1]WRH86694.1 OPT family oligopeptide transporter [Nguyenibacter sp. L1]